jgi:hypothetical protein
MSMKNSSDTIGNRTRDLPACSTVPQPTAPPRAPLYCVLDRITAHQINTKLNGVFSAPYLNVNMLVLLSMERTENEFIGFVT